MAVEERGRGQLEGRRGEQQGWTSGDHRFPPWRPKPQSEQWTSKNLTQLQVQHPQCPLASEDGRPREAARRRRGERRRLEREGERRGSRTRPTARRARQHQPQDEQQVDQQR